MHRRAVKKAETRRRVQDTALRLFEQQGFDNTTVGQIAAVAGVSHMTVFRHFPTKEDLVGDHEFGDELKQLIMARPDDEDPVLRVQRSLHEGFAQIYASGRESLRRRTELMLSAPSLRARRLLNHAQREADVAEALATNPELRDEPYRAKVIAAACVGAMNAAFVEWINDEASELPDLMNQAFDLLRAQRSVPARPSAGEEY